MKTLLSILLLVALVGTGAFAQKKEFNTLVVTDVFKFEGGNPDSLMVLVSGVGGNARWVYITALQDSFNTGVYDSLSAVLGIFNQLRLRDSTFAADGSILTVAQDSGVVGCFTCDSLRELSDSVYNSPWTYNAESPTDVTLRDIDKLVGIGTIAPTAKLTVEGDISFPNSNINGSHRIWSKHNDTYKEILFGDDAGITFRVIDSSDVMNIIQSNFTLDAENLQFYPHTRMQINGQIMIEDGTESNGYILTSDAVGNATWQAPASPILEDTAVPGTCYTIVVTNGVLVPTLTTCP